ncbi:MAG: ABC transporter permease [Clostridia bacterium]|nr:ABC transporter permease [Clostridia bacterium]
MLAPIALIILFAFFCLASESFRSSYTMKAILENSYYIGFLAFGVTFVIMTGGIDLSIGTSMICSALIGCYFYSNLGLPLWLAVWLVPIIAMLFGLLNGVMIAKLKLPPFIATLGTQMITTGFGQIVTKVTTQYYPTTGSANTWFKTVTYRAGTFPIGVCYLIAAFLIAFFLLNRTKFGRYTLAIGSNEEAARLSGVNTDNWKIAVYAVCGLFVGFAGIMYAAVNTVIIPGYGAGQELNGIAAVVIGGTSMSGGSGSIVGTIIGVFIMSVLKSGLPSVGLQSHWQTFFTGFVVIGAVLLDQLRTASAQKVKTEKRAKVKKA